MKTQDDQTVPSEFDEATRCPECHTRLHFSGSGWCCPVSLSHAKLVRDGLMVERLSLALASHPDLCRSAEKPGQVPAEWILREARSWLRRLKLRQRSCLVHNLP